MSTRPQHSSSSQLSRDCRTTALRDVCTVIRGVGFDKSTARRSSAPGHLPILRAGNIQDTLALDDDLVWVPEHFVSASQRLRVNDIVICMSSGSASVVGKTAQLDHSWNGSVGAFCAIIRPKENVAPAYLSSWFRSPSFIGWRDEQARGANIQNLRVSQLESMRIALPPLQDQKDVAARIAEQMEMTGRLRAALHARLEAARALQPAIYRSMFQGAVCSTWPRRPLRDVCDFLDSRRLPVNERERSSRIAGKTPQELYPYYGANGQVGWIDGYLFDEPLILLAEDGGFFGSHDRPIAYAVSGKYWVNNHAHVLKPHRDMDFDFVLHSLRLRPDVGDLVSGSTRAKLNQDVAGRIEIPVPPLEVQRRVATALRGKLSVAAALQESCEVEEASTREMPSVLLRAAFAGAH